MAIVEWTDTEKVIMNSMIKISNSYLSMRKDLSVLVAEMDDFGTQPWKSILQDILDKYSDLSDE